MVEDPLPEVAAELVTPAEPEPQAESEPQAEPEPEPQAEPEPEPETKQESPPAEPEVNSYSSDSVVSPCLCISAVWLLALVECAQSEFHSQLFKFQHF